MQLRPPGVGVHFTRAAIADSITNESPAAQATSLITGVIRALNKMQLRRIVVATPYLDEVNQREVDYLEQVGFEVISICGLNLKKDRDMVRVAPEFIADFAPENLRSVATRR